MNLHEEMDKLAELVAQRAKRKLGQPRDLRLVGQESAPPAEAAPTNTLPDLAAHEAVDVSPRAMKMHEISMIAAANGWKLAITHFLRLKGVPYMSDLTDPQLDDLLGRMQGYVDAAEMGCSLPDCLPAA